jgi:uncharacterized protein YbjT (DUF2867 family)
MFVIFGATGKIGRAAAKALRERGAAVRVVVRDVSRGRELVDWGCELAVADLSDSVAVGHVVAGADAVQVICPLDPRAPDAAGPTIPGRPLRFFELLIRRPALAEIVGDGRPWTVLTISLLSMPCR